MRGTSSNSFRFSNPPMKIKLSRRVIEDLPTEEQLREQFKEHTKSTGNGLHKQFTEKEYVDWCMDYEIIRRIINNYI